MAVFLILATLYLDYRTTSCTIPNKLSYIVFAVEDCSDANTKQVRFAQKERKEFNGSSRGQSIQG